MRIVAAVLLVLWMMTDQTPVYAAKSKRGAVSQPKEKSQPAPIPVKQYAPVICKFDDPADEYRFIINSFVRHPLLNSGAVSYGSYKKGADEGLVIAVINDLDSRVTIVEDVETDAFIISLFTKRTPRGMEAVISHHAPPPPDAEQMQTADDDRVQSFARQGLCLNEGEPLP